MTASNEKNLALEALKRTPQPELERAIRYESYEGVTTKSVCSDCKKRMARRYRCVACLKATLDDIRSEIAAMEGAN